MAAFLIAGMFGYFSLPVSELPNVDFPTIVVQAGLPGADAETMASSVAAPLEKQFSLIAGLDTMTSTNVLGATQITLQFRLDRNIDAASQDVQSAASAAAARHCRANMPSPPSCARSIRPRARSFQLTVTSTTLPLRSSISTSRLLIVKADLLGRRRRRGDIFGQARPAVRIQVDPAALAVRGIGIDEVATAIRNVNVNLATGQLDGPSRSAVIQTEGQLTEAAELPAADPRLSRRRAGPLRRRRERRRRHREQHDLRHL